MTNIIHAYRLRSANERVLMALRGARAELAATAEVEDVSADTLADAVNKIASLEGALSITGPALALYEQVEERVGAWTGEAEATDAVRRFALGVALAAPEPHRDGREAVHVYRAAGVRGAARALLLEP